MATNKETARSGEDVEKPESSITAVGNVKWCSHCEKPGQLQNY